MSRYRNKLTFFELCVIVILGLIVAYTTYTYALPYLNNAWGNLKNDTPVEQEKEELTEENICEITINVLDCEKTAIIQLLDSDGEEIECKSSSENQSIYNIEKDITYTIKVVASGYITHTQEIEPTEDMTYIINLKEGAEF